MEWLLGAGPIMIPLLVCSVFSLAIIMERAINLRKNKILKPEIIQTIEAIKSPRDIPFAISKCEVIEGPFSNLLRRILSNNHLSREEKFIDIQAMGRQETRVLEKRLWLLEVITAIAPLLGLLGTVLGWKISSPLSLNWDLDMRRRLPEAWRLPYVQRCLACALQFLLWLHIIILTGRWMVMSVK